MAPPYQPLPDADQAGFAWSDRYLLGHHAIDATHREFVELVDALLTAPDSALGAALQAFAEHAERHFSDEKNLMDSGVFPARDCHVEEHDKVLASVHEVQQLVAAGDIGVGRQLASALKDWFPAHADYMDSALSKWLSNRKFAGAPVVLKRSKPAH